MVDKPTKGNTITIKLNGEKHSFSEESKKGGQKASNSPDKTGVKIYTDQVEEGGTRETAAAQESVDESFDWIIPEAAENDIEEYKIVSTKGTEKKNKKKPSLLIKNPLKKDNRALGPILLSGVFAILLGTSFGFLMLKLVTPDQSKTEKAATVPSAVEQTVTETAPPKAAASVAIKPLTAYVVQEGVYSSKDAAKAAANKVAAHDIPSQSIEIDGKHYLFLAAADTQETAKALGTLYKGKGVKEVFSKSLTIKEKTVSNLNEAEKSFLEAAPAIYQSLANMSASAIASKTISNDAAKVIGEQLKGNGLKNEKVKSLKAELSTAEEKIKAYQKTKETKNLNDAQQNLLNFLSSYYSM